MNEKLFKETFSRLRASETSKKELIDMTNGEEFEKNRRRMPRAAKRVLVCAAVIATLLALTVTALAVSEYLGGWTYSIESTSDFTGVTHVFLERNEIEQAMVPNEDFGADPVEAADKVILPIAKGAKVIVDENDRVLVYVYIFNEQDNLVDEIYDVTDELAASPDGTYTITDMGQAEDGTYWNVYLTVLPVTEGMDVKEGHYGYVLRGDISCWWYVDGFDRPFSSNLTMDGWSWNSEGCSWRNEELNLVDQTWVRHAKVLGNLEENSEE